MRRLVLILLLLVSVALSSAQFSRPALALTGDTTVLYVSPGSVSSAKPNGGSTTSFSVNVNLNLSSTDAVAGYDIYMSYNSTVLRATGLQAGNLFPSDRIVNASYCVNDLGYNCSGLDSYNVVHWSVAYLDGAVSGPSYSRTVFSVQFSVLGIGHSFLQLFNDTLFGAVDSSGVSPDVVHVSWNGVYSNNGLQAFFNVAPAILLINNPVHFDASATFNPDDSSVSYRSSLAYSWDFGDGTGGIGVTVSHSYSSARTYNVNLVVIDAFGKTSTVSRMVIIVPALGGLTISVKDMTGKEVYLSVTLKLFSGSSLVKALTRQAGNTDPFVMSGLVPGLYRLDFSGSGFTPASKQENVVAGVVRVDIVYLAIQTPTQAQSGLLTYKLTYRGVAYPGGSLILVQSFTSIDVTMDVRINAFLIRTDWDFLNATGRAFGLPLNVSGGQTKTLETILNLPANLPLGNHTIQVNVNWDYYYLYGGYWAGGNPIIFNSTFRAYSSSLGPFSLWGAGFETLLWGFLTYLAIACSITLVFVYREEKQRKAFY